MTYQPVTYTGTGVLLNFTIPFPFIEDDDVVVTVGGVLQTLNNEYIIIDGNVVLFVQAAPGLGVQVKIERRTDRDEVSSELQPGSTLPAEDLNDNFRQTLYISQELQGANDANETSITGIIDSLSDVLPYTIVPNVAAIPGSPTAGQLVEILDSTGIQSFTPLSGRPFGFSGSTAMKVRLRWGSPISTTWNWVDAFPINADGRYVQKANDRVNVIDFGAVGNGTTDDSAAIQAAVNSLTNGGEVFFPSGRTYRVNTTITSTGKNLHWNAPGARFVVATDIPLFILYGGWEHVQQVLSSTSTTLVVANASLYNEEDVLKIRGPARLPINESNGFMGEFAVVKAVNTGTNTITVCSPFLWDYNASFTTPVPASPGWLPYVTVAKISDAKIRVDIMEVSGDIDTDQSFVRELMWVEACKNAELFIQSVPRAFSGAGAACSCYGGRWVIGAIDWAGEWGGSFTPPQLRQVGGYGLVPKNTEHMTFRVINSRRGRHVYDGLGDNTGFLSHSRCGAAAYNTFEACNSFNSVGCTFAQHDGTYRSRFYDCWDIGGEEGIMSFRGQGHRFYRGGGINTRGALFGTLVSSGAPLADTDDNEVIGAVVRGATDRIAVSAGDASGLLTLTDCDVEVLSLSGSSSSLFSLAGRGIRIKGGTYKMRGGTLSTSVITATVAPLADTIAVEDATFDFTGATLSSVRFILNQTGGATAAPNAVVTMRNVTIINPSGSNILHLLNDTAELPSAPMFLGDIRIRGGFTAIHTNFANREMLPYIDGPIIQNNEVLIRPASGGSVSQSTNKANPVTLNKQNGQIITTAAALAGNTTVSFTLNNSRIAANSCVVVNRISGGTAATYQVWCDSVADGTAVICIRNTSGGSLSEALTLHFNVLPGMATA